MTQRYRMPRWYRMHDAEPRGVMEIDYKAAIGWNVDGFGIFATVNEFDGPRRIENLTRIVAWAVDIDDGDKEDMKERLMHGPLMPSRVIETKRGYQAYWNAIDGTKENWDAIVLNRLVPWYGADKNARDIARILRVPGFYHLKDPNDPFLVREVFQCTATYREAEMLQHYPDQVAKEAEKREKYMARTREDRELYGDTIWNRIYDIDCVEGLSRLSGHSVVAGEQFTFMRCRNGNHNILVNGKGTSCWVDRAGHIGSLDKGGPTLLCWIMWYGISKGTAVAVIKELFPEIEGPHVK